MPRLTIPHYYDFGDDRAQVGDSLSTAEDWDALRVGTDGPFGIAADAAGWAAQAKQHPELRSRAAIVADAARALGAASVASYGVGGASVEYWLTQDADDLSLTVTEYAPETLRLLASFMPDATALRHDLLEDGPADADVHLFHRIDTEFSNAQLRQIMGRFASAKMIVVATRLLNWREVKHELRHRRNPRATRAGVYRTRATFEAIWKRTHIAERAAFGELAGWVLHPR